MRGWSRRTTVHWGRSIRRGEIRRICGDWESYLGKPSLLGHFYILQLFVKLVMLHVAVALRQLISPLLSRPTRHSTTTIHEGAIKAHAYT